MSHFCCCCASCKPRYKRLVDQIYPRTPPFDIPHSGNMQKLTFYSISHPEKLNRIGIYLVQRLSRDLSRQRVADVKVAVDAMDQLLKSCHGSPSLNQFIESYLLMVQRLLETNDPQMEKLATDLFVRFSGIEEDSPSYHRQYDFFISKFSSMCHANGGGYVRSQRFNGLRGLRGVIWKSASDDLQANIWEKQHMNKIIPSILFNFQDENDDSVDQQVDHSTGMLFHHYPEEGSTIAEIEPRSLALQCLRELFQKCSFGSLKSVLEPVFKHLDNHKKWEPPATFAIKTFKAILYSIQSQNSYFVIQELINQLELVSNPETQMRVGMATVLASIVSIAGTSIGPLLLAIFNSLLKQLRSSVEFQQSKQCTDLDGERTFQDTLINALGDFASALPDYQKVEIMMFTAGSIPTILNGVAGTGNGNNVKPVQTSDAFLQKVLVKTLLEVATKYKTFYLATVFTDAFLKTLFQLQLTQDSEVRLIALRIFHTLLDRHDNHSKLEHLPSLVPEIQEQLQQLSVEKCSRQDQLFMRRHIATITSTLYRNINMTEKDQTIKLSEQLDAVLCAMALLCVEVSNDEIQVELLRFAFSLQHFALEAQMSAEKRAAVHNLVARFTYLSSQLLSIPALCQYIQQVIKARAQQAHPLLNLMNGDIGRQLKREGKEGGAYSPPAEKAPIAHMDSEEEVGDQHRGMVDGEKSQRSCEGNEGDRTLDLNGQPTLQFSAETVYEALKASNKEAHRLLQPFKPLSVSQSALAFSQQKFVASPSSALLTVSDTQLQSDDGAVIGPRDLSVITNNTSTSGGLMFSSPMNTRRNMSAMDVCGVLVEERKEGDKANESEMAKLDTPQQRTHQGCELSQQNSVDTGSIGSSSVDWSPPDSHLASRRNTELGQKELNLPITVEQLRIMANTPIDPEEEERKDQEKSREVLQMFRDKDAKQLAVLFRRHIGRNCCCSSTSGIPCPHQQEGVAHETLAQTLQRVTARHEEKTKMREYGSQGSAGVTIFDIKFPPSFEM